MAKRTKYKKEFCIMLVEHMKKGLSFRSFGAIANVHSEALYNWVKKHKDFAEAKALGESYSLLFWEKLGMSGAAGKLKNFNAASWIFNMKNRFKWRDKQEIEHSNPDGTMNKTTVIMLPSNEREKEE